MGNLLQQCCNIIDIVLHFQNDGTRPEVSVNDHPYKDCDFFMLEL